MGAEPEVGRRSHGHPAQDSVCVRTCRASGDARGGARLVDVCHRRGGGHRARAFRGACGNCTGDAAARLSEDSTPEGAPRVLGGYPEDLSGKAEKLLTQLGVEVIKGVMVTQIAAEGVTFKRGESTESLAARTVLWAGGVTSTPFGERLAQRTKAETDRSGRIKVKRDLTIPNYPDVFIIGDLAHAEDEKGQPLPGVTQVAMQGGAYAAKTIRARLEGKPLVRPFHYFNKGDLAVIGRAAAVANIFGVHI